MNLCTKSFFTAVILSASMVTTAALADVVQFYAFIKGRQYFECTASVPTANIQLDTSNVDAQGFCSAYPGHLTTSGDIVSNNYFVVRNSGINPSMKITASAGTVTCKNLSGSDCSRSEYASGQSFCSMPPLAKN